MVYVVKISNGNENRSFEVNERYPHGEGTYTFPKGTDLHSCCLQIFADALWDWAPDSINPVEDCGCYHLAFMAEQELEWIAAHVVKRTNPDDSGSDDAGEVVLHITLE